MTMTTHATRVTGFILIGLLLQAPTFGGDPGLPICPLGLIEGPDPIGRTCVTDPDVKPQAPQGLSRPELGQLPQDGTLFLVWADGPIGARDIAFATWIDGGWSKAQFLASTAADERDPRVSVTDDGTLLVTWWTDGGDPGVYYTSREPLGGRWSAPVRVATDGRRPSIARLADRTLVAFERTGSDGSVGLVVAVEGAAGARTEQVVRADAGSGPLDARLRVERGRAWVEWSVSPRRIGWSEWVDGTWSRSGTVAVAGSSWKAGQSAREEVRDIVLGP